MHAQHKSMKSPDSRAFAASSVATVTSPNLPPLLANNSRAGQSVDCTYSSEHSHTLLAQRVWFQQMKP